MKFPLKIHWKFIIEFQIKFLMKFHIIFFADFHINVYSEYHGSPGSHLQWGIKVGKCFPSELNLYNREDDPLQFLYFKNVLIFITVSVNNV